MHEGRGSGAGSDRPVVDRRRFLGGVAAAVAGGLAGCNADGYDIVDSTDTFGHAFPYDPKSLDLNPWPSASYPLQFYTMLFEPLSVRAPGDGYVLTDVVDELTIDGSTARLHLSDAYTWWNGDPVVARDQWVYERLQSAVSPESRPSVELVDEHTLAYEFDGPRARPVIYSAIAADAVNTAAWLFEQWVDRFEAAGTDAAHEGVRDRLHEWQVSLERSIDEGFGNAPYRLVESSVNRVMMEPFEDHPRAPDIEIPQLWFPVLQNISREDFIAQGRVDGGRGLLASVKGENDAPAFMEQLDSYQTTNGAKLALDWRNPHLGRLGVRRAVLAAAPIPQVVEVGEFGDPKTVQTGLAEPADERWLGDLEEFRTHPLESDLDRAAEHLREAGYERGGGGDWRGPDGEKVRFRLRSPLWENWKFAARPVVSVLDDFGFEVDFNQIANSRLIADVESHNFDAILWPSDARPFRTYDVSATSSWTMGYGVDDPHADRSEQGKPIEVAVPGRSDTVNLVEEWHRLRSATDEATQRESIRTFARWWNVALPDIQLATQVTGVWGNTRDFDWPAADGNTYRLSGPDDHPEFRLLNHGLVTSGDGRTATDG